MNKSCLLFICVRINKWFFRPIEKYLDDDESVQIYCCQPSQQKFIAKAYKD